MDSKKKNKPILLVGGGTGGHIMPLIAIGEELSSRDLPFIFVGGIQSKEEELVRHYQWHYVSIQAGKWRRYTNFKSIVANLTDIFRLAIGFFQSLQIIIKSKSEIIVSKGGYVALPVVYAARLLGRRVIIHESDTVMGLTNRLSSTFAKKVLTAFDPKIFTNSDGRYQQVGIPIRRALRMAAKLKSPMKSRPLLLILPGSQASQAINNLLEPILPKLLEHYDVIHLTGSNELEKFQKFRQGLPTEKQHSYKPYAFIDRELPYYFQSADLILCRASMTTIAEASLFGKPVYLIPLPTAAADHQISNAKRLELAGAAFVRLQNELTSEKLYEDIKKLLSDKVKLEALGKSLKTYFNESDAVELFLKEIGL